MQKGLERSRRENITEITLEPIEGLNSEDYNIDITHQSLGAVNLNEKIICKFYEEAGPKLNVREARFVFQRHLKRHFNLKNLE